MSTPPGANGTEPIRVIIVDDQELFRRGLTMLLGVEDDIDVVGEAGDGIAATELAATAAPDVILMDVRMPKRSGIEACVAIKDIAPTARIIMLTVSDEEADLYDAVKNGASGYLLKDSSIDEVAQAIRVVADGQSWGFPDCYGQGGSACACTPSPVAVLDAHAAVSGVAIVTGQLGAAVGTAAVVAEWSTGTLLSVPLDPAAPATQSTASTFVTGIGKPVAVAIGADGALYAGDWASGTIYRITPAT